MSSVSMADCDKARPIVPLQMLVMRKTVVSPNIDVSLRSTDGCTLVGVRKGGDVSVLSAVTSARTCASVMVSWPKTCVDVPSLVGGSDR